MKIIKENGFYKIYEYCDNCGLEISKETNSFIVFRKTILKQNKLPQYCPYCGKKLFEKG